MLKVNEIFPSYQGEGIFAGAKTFFVRLSGCNLKCEWCDSKGTWNNTNSKNMTAEQILDAIEESEYKGHNVCITGGEPLLQQNDPEFMNLLSKLQALHLSDISIESNGTILPSEYTMRHISTYAFSPKLRCMGGPGRVDTRTLKEIDSAIFLHSHGARVIYKFVVDIEEDKFNQCLKEINDIREVVDMPAADIFLMPIGTDPLDILKDTQKLMNLKHPYSVSTRQHILFNQR